MRTRGVLFETKAARFGDQRDCFRSLVDNTLTCRLIYMSTILIVDPDLGFVCWLGQTLHSGGYESVPSKNTSNAARLLRELDITPDVLVINSSVRGASGFADKLQRANSKLKIISVGVNGKAGALPTASMNLSRPLIPDSAAKSKWLKAIDRVSSPGSSLSMSAASGQVFDW